MVRERIQVTGQKTITDTKYVNDDDDGLPNWAISFGESQSHQCMKLMLS